MLGEMTLKNKTKQTQTNQTNQKTFPGMEMISYVYHQILWTWGIFLVLPFLSVRSICEVAILVCHAFFFFVSVFSLQTKYR